MSDIGVATMWLDAKVQKRSPSEEAPTLLWVVVRLATQRASAGSKSVLSGQTTVPVRGSRPLAHAPRTSNPKVRAAAPSTVS
jgi:hypothetical protein